jgi:hypothetical protein
MRRASPCSKVPRSPEPSEVIGALSMLESVQHESLRSALVKLLDHRHQA